jgi:hypothetical protein
MKGNTGIIASLYTDASPACVAGRGLYTRLPAESSKCVPVTAKPFLHQGKRLVDASLSTTGRAIRFGMDRGQQVLHS